MFTVHCSAQTFSITFVEPFFQNSLSPWKCALWRYVMRLCLCIEAVTYFFRCDANSGHVHWVLTTTWMNTHIRIIDNNAVQIWHMAAIGLSEFWKTAPQLHQGMYTTEYWWKFSFLFIYLSNRIPPSVYEIFLNIKSYNKMNKLQIIEIDVTTREIFLCAHFQFSGQQVKSPWSWCSCNEEGRQKAEW